MARKVVNEQSQAITIRMGKQNLLKPCVSDKNDVSTEIR